MRAICFIFLAILAIETNLYAAEAGMPQLDPKYWASQAFWLVITFAFLYLAIAKLFVPKIRNVLNDRSNKIKNDLDEAKNLKDISEKKLKDYDLLIVEAKKEVHKILTENKNNLKTEIENKRKVIEKEINSEVEKIQIEIAKLKKNSIDDIEKISEEIASKIIEEISGEKLNQSSIKAAISESTKKNINKYL